MSIETLNETFIRVSMDLTIAFLLFYLFCQVLVVFPVQTHIKY